MSGSELLAIIAGLIIGYWVVVRFGSNRKSTEKQTGYTESDPKSARRNERADKDAGQQEAQRATPPEQAPWHVTLNVAPGANEEEIRRAYKTLMSQYHPDKVATLGPELRDLCERKTKEINTAYDQAMRERHFE